MVYDVAVARTDRDAWVLRTLNEHEPAAVHTQIPIVWRGAHGSTVVGSDGDRWIDWTSGIAVTNAGHAPPSVVQAIVDAAQAGPLHSYLFPTEVRAHVVKAISSLTGLQQCVLYSTGAEAVEAALKISRLHAQRSGRAGTIIVSFDGAFHGRTQGAQYVGGQQAQRSWLPDNDVDYLRLPYPDNSIDAVAALLDHELARRSLTADHVAAVIVEPWQGSTLRQLSAANAQSLRDWCSRHDVPLILDEIQTGFGRSGTLFAFQALGVSPDMLLLSKGLSGSLPVSGVCVADPRWTASVRRGELTSTHGGNPIALAATLANMALYADGTLVEHARVLGEELQSRLQQWAGRDSHRRHVRGIGMIAGVVLHDEKGHVDLATPRQVVHDCADRGLLLVTPVTMGGAMIKIMPPLTTSFDELDDGLQIFFETAEALMSSSPSSLAGSTRG